MLHVGRDIIGSAQAMANVIQVAELQARGTPSARDYFFKFCCLSR